ncbi:uncharacterized protein LOC109605340 isoform X2 [Aethina tumida]|nr:uncharacterized protein LOC109605340 isoform X2 [Aethina tumida]XP_049822738.1 uncharacterized protein LOC109605340 isoform X2 [Aethina tumida]XP_049822739.1 uncharacterized protein LOC109605340 isoform X2 [Aethina tumida]
MPKREASAPVKGRTYSRRAASKEALKQMHLILDDEAETLEVRDDDVIPVDFPAPSPPKKKYKLTHRKSSDGDREVLVFKSITNHNVENTLDLECWVEPLSEAQLARNKKINEEATEIENKLTSLLSNVNSELIYKGEYTTALGLTEQIKKALQSTETASTSTTPLVINSIVASPSPSYQLLVDPRLSLVMPTSVSCTTPATSVTPSKVFPAKVQVTPTLQPATSTGVGRGRGRRVGSTTPVSSPGSTKPTPSTSTLTPITPATRTTRGAQLNTGKKQGKCEVVGCIKSEAPFHSFPRNSLLCKRWIEACGNPNLHTDRDLKSKKVCHKHFPESSIFKYGGITKHACPILHLPGAKAQATPATKMTTRSGQSQLIIDNVQVGALTTKPTEENVEGGLATGSKSSKTFMDHLNSSSADCREIAFNKLQGKTFPSLVVTARPQLSSGDQNADRSKLDTKVKSVLMHPPTKFIEWLIQQGLLKSEQKCSLHNTPMSLGMYSDTSNFPYSGGYVWISECCPQKFVSVFNGSLFECSPHPPMVLLKLLYHWACQTNIQNVVQWVKVDNLYIKGVYTWLRSVCTVALHTHSKKLGGPGVKVEVGVISLGTTSQDGAQRQVKVEVLGVLETHTNTLRLRAVEPVTDGDKNYRKRFYKILEPIIQWVHPSSTIVADLTVDRATMYSMGFNHVVQNEYGTDNAVIMEYLRRIVPRMFQNTLSLLSRQIIQQFLDELVWRETYGSNATKAFDNIILHIAELTRQESKMMLFMRLNKVSLNPFKNWSLTGSQPVVLPKTAEPPVPPKKLGRPKKSDTVKAVSTVVDVSRPPKSNSPDIPEQLVPLENYYYGTIEDYNYHPPANFTMNVKCPFCKEVFNNNLQLMNHLYKHAHSISMDAQLCRYCLTSVPTANDILKHFSNTHPCETRFNNGFVCLICETHYMNPFILGKHMSKEHCPSELPYQCGTCSYRCSNHKQVIEHFYKAHDGGNTIQCPFCLKATTISTTGRNVVQTLNFFITHLQRHQKKQYAKRCGKCNMWFISKEEVKEHQQKMHTSQRGKTGLIPWIAPRNGVLAPKSKTEKYPGDAQVINFSTLFFSAPKGAKCKECNLSLNSSKHFPSFESCQNPNCQYSTCCANAMVKHKANCSKQTEIEAAEEPLPYEMFCVCGFSSKDGNCLAKHLAICERKSAYPTMKEAKSACVTHSMLDVLGLVRKPEETVSSDKKKIDSKTSKSRIVEEVDDALLAVVKKPIIEPEKVICLDDDENSESVSEEENKPKGQIVDKEPDDKSIQKDDTKSVDKDPVNELIEKNIVDEPHDSNVVHEPDAKDVINEAEEKSAVDKASDKILEEEVEDKNADEKEQNESVNGSKTKDSVDCVDKTEEKDSAVEEKDTVVEENDNVEHPELKESSKEVSANMESSTEEVESENKNNKNSSAENECSNNTEHMETVEPESLLDSGNVTEVSAMETE